jgi:hypothetical protein
MNVSRWSWRRWLGRLVETRERRRLHTRMKRALQLRPRGGCAQDHLTVTRISTQLEVEWCARDLHPWDRDLPAIRRNELFLEQCRHDTLVAVQRMFEQLSEVDVIDIRVLEPLPSARTLLAGTVSRDDLTAATTRPRSTRMVLKLIGIHYEAAEQVLYVRHAESRAVHG